MPLRPTLAIVATFLVAGLATTYLPVTESAANSPRPAVTSTPSPSIPAGVVAPTGEVRHTEITDVDGITHPDCLLYVGDTSVVVCSDGFTEES